MSCIHLAAHREHSSFEAKISAEPALYVLELLDLGLQRLNWNLQVCRLRSRHHILAGLVNCCVVQWYTVSHGELVQPLYRTACRREPCGPSSPRPVWEAGAKLLERHSACLPRRFCVGGVLRDTKGLSSCLPCLNCRHVFSTL
jgi:hypothetical protein